LPTKHAKNAEKKQRIFVQVSQIKFWFKLGVIAVFVCFGLVACFNSGSKKVFVIAESKSYETSLFRQHCAICHGPEGDGKTQDDGKQVPSLRVGEFKFKTADEIYHQIAEGGNGMTPFKGQLTERELRLMTEFVRKDLRGGQTGQ
jgi:mono/diheme cytochrome c family protein